MRKILFILGLLAAITVKAQQQITIICPKCGYAIKVTISVDGTATAIHEPVSASFQSNQCKGITAQGTQCSRKAQEGSEYCWQHEGKNGTAATTTTMTITNPQSVVTSTLIGRCRATTKYGKRCSRTAKSNGYCWQHGE